MPSIHEAPDEIDREHADHADVAIGLHQGVVGPGAQPDQNESLPHPGGAEVAHRILDVPADQVIQRALVLSSEAVTDP